MSWKSVISTIAVLGLLLFAGCQLLYDLWPAEISPLAVKYAGEDPNKINPLYENMRTAKNLRNKIVDVYIEKQLDLEYQANLNKEKYKLALEVLDLAIKQAE